VVVVVCAEAPTADPPDEKSPWDGGQPSQWRKRRLDEGPIRPEPHRASAGVIRDHLYAARWIGVVLRTATISRDHLLPLQCSFPVCCSPSRCHLNQCPKHRGPPPPRPPPHDATTRHYPRLPFTTHRYFRKSRIFRGLEAVRRAAASVHTRRPIP
jgi:hypothetical protein